MNPQGILIVGVYYAGKTVTADFIGKATGMQVLDLDEAYTSRFRESIFETRQKDASLADRNRDTIAAEILNRMRLGPTVAVLGGGSFLRANPGVLADVRRTHWVVHLDPPVDTLIERVQALEPGPDEKRLFDDLETGTLDSFFRQKLRQHGHYYVEWRDEWIEPATDDWPISRVGHEVLSRFVAEQRRRFEDEELTAFRVKNVHEPSHIPADELIRLLQETRSLLKQATKVGRIEVKVIDDLLSASVADLRSAIKPWDRIKLRMLNALIVLTMLVQLSAGVDDAVRNMHKAFGLLFSSGNATSVQGSAHRPFGVTDSLALPQTPKRSEPELDDESI